MMQLHMRPIEYQALRSIVLEYVLTDSATQEWIDVVTDEKVTLEELLSLVLIGVEEVV